MTRVGRKAPCPCGSGRRYKRCCGEGDATASFMSACVPLDPTAPPRWQPPRMTHPVTSADADAAFARLGRIIAGGGLLHVPGAGTFAQIAGNPGRDEAARLTLGLLFTDWLLFDASRVDGPGVCDMIADIVADNGRTGEAACLRAWQRCSLTIWRVDAVDGERLRLVPDPDVGPEQDPIEVDEVPLAELPRPGDYLAARALPRGDGRWTLSQGIIVFAEPVAMIAGDGPLAVPFLASIWLSGRKALRRRAA